VEEVAHATGVGDGINICGRRTVIVKSGANVVTTMFSLSVGSHPCLSGNLFFVVGAASFGVSSSGVTLVTGPVEVAALTGVCVVNVKVVCPTVVFVVVTTFGGVSIAWSSGVIAWIVAALLGSKFGFESVDLCVLLGDELREVLVGGGKVSHHLTVRGCRSGEIGKGIGGVVHEGIHGIVGSMVSCHLCCALG